MNNVFSLKITDIIDEGSNRMTYLLEKPDDFKWDEGSHISVALDGYKVNGKLDNRMIRKFSIFTMDYEKRIGITTRLDSSESEYKKKMSKFCIGDLCHIIEYGSRMKLRRENRPVVLISMGVGMATMRPLIKSFLDDESGIPYITNIVVNKSSDYLYKDELEVLENDKYKTINFKGRKELKNGLKEMDFNNAIFYVVGSKDFLKSTIEILKTKGADNKSVMIDRNEGIIDLYFDKNDYESMKVKNYGISKKFVPLVIPNGCACGGNCTCK